MKRMHKPDPRLAPDKQDKRSLVLLNFDEVDQWLRGTVEEARALVKLTPSEAFDAAPADPPTAVRGLPPPELPEQLEDPQLF